MRFTVTDPPADAIVDVDAVLYHLRVDDAGGQEIPYIEALIAAATAYAEEIMETSIAARTITATYFAGDTLYLPRGPVERINSVAINGIAQPEGTYSLEAYGHSELLRFNSGTVQPFPAPTVMTVEYVAGYCDVDAIPADIKQIILCHVGLLYENRELATEAKLTPVPFLDGFYKMRSRGAGVG